MVSVRKSILSVSNYRCKKGWQDLYHYGYEEGTLFADLLDEVKDKVRIILIVGPLDSHLGLVEAVDELSKQNIMSHSPLKNVLKMLLAEPFLQVDMEGPTLS